MPFSEAHLALPTMAAPFLKRAKPMKMRAITMFGLSLLCVQTAQAQTSPLYMISYDSDRAVIVQNGVVIQEWHNSGAFAESALAIHETIRVVGRNSPQDGREYDLNGNLLGGGPYNNPAWLDLYDG